SRHPRGRNGPSPRRFSRFCAFGRFLNWPPTMNMPVEPLAPAMADFSALLGRVDQLEAFGSQVSAAVESLVGGLVELQQKNEQVAQLQARLRELEQQVSIERSCTELTRVSR